MKKTKNVLKAILSTAVGLSLVACAQQENPLVVPDGTYRPMTNQEVLEKGLDKGGNNSIQQSRMSPNLYRINNIDALETLTISTKGEEKTYTLNLTALDYQIESQLPSSEEEAKALNGKTLLGVYKKSDESSTSTTAVYVSDKETGKAVIKKMTEKKGSIAGLEKVEESELDMSKAPAGDYMAIETAPITNSIILVKFYDLQVLDGQTIPTYVDGIYYQTVFKSELDKMNAAMIEVNNKLAKVLADKEKALVTVEDNKANPDQPVVVKDVTTNNEIENKEQKEDQIPTVLPEKLDNDANTSELNEDNKNTEDETDVEDKA